MHMFHTGAFDYHYTKYRMYSRSNINNKKEKTQMTKFVDGVRPPIDPSEVYGVPQVLSEREKILVSILAGVMLGCAIYLALII